MALFPYLAMLPDQNAFKLSLSDPKARVQAYLDAYRDNKEYDVSLHLRVYSRNSFLFIDKN